jgi:hypothetical protein
MFNEIELKDFEPFAERASLCSLDGLTIENNQDRLSLYGSLNIAQDQQGLAQAQALKALLEQVISHLQAQQDLPEKLDYPPEEEVDNPFL